MREATIRLRYEANCAHNLPDHKGKCKRVHGHNYGFEIDLGGPIIEEDGPSRGMIIDFDEAEEIIKKEVIDVLDHQLINEIITPDSCYYPPTTENLAYWVFDKLYEHFGPLLLAVAVNETAKSKVFVTREDFDAWTISTEDPMWDSSSYDPLADLKANALKGNHDSTDS